MKTTNPTTPTALSGSTNSVTRVTVRNPKPRIKGGFCGCHTEYVGPNPVSNYAILVGLELIKGLGASALVLGIWFAKEKIKRKMGWVKDSTEAASSPVESTNTPSLSTDTSVAPTTSSLAKDIANAVKNGAPVKMCGGHIHEGERAVFVSGPGVGKSISAVQLGICFGAGQPCGLFPGENESGPQKVLLIDAEQEDEDLFLRYGEMADSVSENITRMSNCHFNSPEEACETIKEVVSDWNGNGTVIIDNITALFSLQSAEKVRSFYGMLKGIQTSAKERGFKLTLIIICHEAKSATKLTLKSIQGSGNIGNFATSVFALGHSSIGDNKRYLKVLKARRGPKIGNVYLLDLVTKPYFHFEYLGEVSETEATGKTEDQAMPKDTQTPVNHGQRKLSDEQIEQVRQLYAKGASVYALGEQFGVNRNTIKKYLGIK